MLHIINASVENIHNKQHSNSASYISWCIFSFVAACFFGWTSFLGRGLGCPRRPGLCLSPVGGWLADSIALTIICSNTEGLAETTCRLCLHSPNRSGVPFISCGHMLTHRWYVSVTHSLSCFSPSLFCETSPSWVSPSVSVRLEVVICGVINGRRKDIIWA